MYADAGLTGGHIIKLGGGNEAAALEALGAFPGGMHIGGGVNAENAKGYIDAGASHVIVTSFVFKYGLLKRTRNVVMQTLPHLAETERSTWSDFRV